MSFERLEIIRLSELGETKRRIICLAGRVSVFRSRLDADLEVYSNTLIGRPVTERFSVLLDGESFVPENHLRIGFGESFFEADERTLGTFLCDEGVEASAVEGLLYSNGLGGLRQARCRDLSPEQQKILRLLAALHSQNKVLILNDPFAGLADQWRESLAERLADWAWKERRIVIVVRLDVRPECWIDNELISRIQLEKPRERTIGFGGGELGSADVMQKLREELARVDAEAEKKKAAGETSPAKPGQRIRRPTARGNLTSVPKPAMKVPVAVKQAVLAAVGVCAAVLLLLFRSIGSPPPVVPVVAPQPVAPPSVPRPVPQFPRHMPRMPLPMPNPVVPSAAAPATLLDAYPPPIRDAVLKAFREPALVLKTISAKAASVPVPTPVAAPRQPQRPEPVQQPAQSSPPNYDPNTVITREPGDEAQLEEQRAILRRQFLEAVARARERQLREGTYNQGETDAPG